MARRIADVFNYEGKQYLDARTIVNNISDFADGSIINAELYYPNGFVAYCEQDKSFYQYLEENEASVTTGKWRRIGGLVDHQKKLGADGKPDYIGIKISSDPDVYTIDEDSIHIFDFDTLNYNVGTEEAPVYEEVKVHKTFQLTEEAKTSILLTNQWTMDETGLKGDIVNGYEKGGAEFSLKQLAWKATGAGVIISKTGVKVDGVDYTYDQIDVDQVKEWAQLNKITSFDLRQTEFYDEDQDAAVMVHIEANKSFDSLGNFTKNRMEYVLAWGDITDEVFERLEACNIIDVDDYDINFTYDNTYGAQIITSIKNIYNLATKINKIEIKTGWVYNKNAGWTKIFPADIELDADSENAVSNSAVTRAVAAAGHKANLIYESDDKVLTLELRDQNDNILSKVAVGLGSVNVSQPKVDFEYEEDLYEKTDEDQVVKITVHAIKINNDIEKVEVFANNTLVKTFDGPEITGETQDLEYQAEFHDTVTFKVKIYDVKQLTGESEFKTAYFVKPCLYNPNGGPAVEKLLTLKGEGKFKFNFDVAPAAGGDPVISAAPIIKIPEQLIIDYGEITTILGGKTEKYLYTDYIESFEKTEPTVDDPYVTYTLKTPCGLQDYYFETIR